MDPLEGPVGRVTFRRGDGGFAQSGLHFREARDFFSEAVHGGSGGGWKNKTILGRHEDREEGRLWDSRKCKVLHGYQGAPEGLCHQRLSCGMQLRGRWFSLEPHR